MQLDGQARSHPLGTARWVGPKLQLVGIRVEPPEAPIVVVALEQLQGGVGKGGIGPEAAIVVVANMVPHVLAVVVVTAAAVVREDALELLVGPRIATARDDVLAEGLAIVLHAARPVSEADAPVVERPALVGQGGVAAPDLHDVPEAGALGAPVGVGPQLELVVRVDSPLLQVVVGVAVVQLHGLAQGGRPNADAAIAVAVHLEEGIVRLGASVAEEGKEEEGQWEGWPST